MSLKKAICEDGTEFERIVNWLTGKISRFLEANGNFIEPYKDFKNDLKSEVSLILLEKKEKLCSKTNINLSYVLFAVKNAVIDKYFRVKTFNQIAFSDFDSENKPLPEEDFSKDRELSPVLFVNSLEALESLKFNLSKKELEILCYRIYSEISNNNPFLSEKSADAKYKAWSRLKRKISELLAPFEFSSDEFKYFINIVVSEICEKLR